MEIKTKFIEYYDNENTQLTYTMGVCMLDYDDDTLIVYLRKPEMINVSELENYLKCKVLIRKVIL